MSSTATSFIEIHSVEEKRGGEENTDSGLMKTSEAGAKRTKEEGGISRGRRTAVVVIKDTPKCRT